MSEYLTGLAVGWRRKFGTMFVRYLSAQILLFRNNDEQQHKNQASCARLSGADSVRSVVTSTAVESGQSAAKIAASLKATRKKFSH